MSQQFNFYQFGSTGDGTCFIFSGGACIWEGPILPITDLHFTDYTGFYITPSILAGQHVGFLWSMNNENKFPAAMNIRYSGEAGNKLNDYPSFSLGLSGDISPLFTDDGTIFINITGDYSGQCNETNTFAVNYSGQITGVPIDNPLFIVGFSGEISSGVNQICNLIVSFTGQQVKQNIDFPQFFVNLSGEMVAVSKDRFSVDCNFSAVSYAIGGKALTINTSGDHAFIDFNFTKISFERPV